MNTHRPRHPDLDAFLTAGDLTAPAFDASLGRRDTPLVEPGALTFLWFGDAERVELLRWMHAGVDRQALTRIAGSDLWVTRVAVRDGGRFEYKLNIVMADGHEHWVLDPRNPHRAGDPFGENSVARAYGYVQPPWSIDRGAPRGRLEDLAVPSEVFGHTRHEQVYLPHDIDASHETGDDTGRHYPLLIVHDGGDFDTFGDLSISLDNLIADGSIPPLIAVLIQTHDRTGEYPRGRRHARYVVNELLSSIAGRYPASDRPSQRVLLGASLGAVASLSTLYRYPGVFGGIVLKSSTFVFDRSKLADRPHPVYHSTARLAEVLRRAPRVAGVRAFVSTGELEGLASDNRLLAEMLEERGMDVRFQSSWDGHHWHNWRDQLRDALTWVLSP